MPVHILHGRGAKTIGEEVLGCPSFLMITTYGMAYRIGQKNHVMVHKLVCKGTIEEKIDEMIASKTELAQNVIGAGGENWITEMSNEELLAIMRLE